MQNQFENVFTRKLSLLACYGRPGFLLLWPKLLSSYCLTKNRDWQLAVSEKKQWNDLGKDKNLCGCFL